MSHELPANEEKAFRLAMIAATLAGPSQDPTWKLPDAERLLAAARDRVEGAVDEPADGPDSEPIAMPKKFPASFKDFELLVVGGKACDRLKRMRDWIEAPEPDSLRRELVPERRIPVGDILADWRKVELDEAQWIHHAKSFRRFWKARDHSNKVQAGKAGQRKRKPAVEPC